MREANKNSPRKEIVEGSMFDGMVSFGFRLSSMNDGGGFKPYTPNKPRIRSRVIKT